MARAKPQGSFGTIGGVFTPCTLTILGVIMFLRFGYVVGQAGVLYALAIVLSAKVITTLTTLSLSAIATNTRVRGGGAYFMISRSLGPEFGGAIGVVFYLAQAISVAMYVIGFSEAFGAAFPALGLDLRTLGTIVNTLVFGCVMIGAGWTIKLQYGILAVLAASIISYVAGALPRATWAMTLDNLGPGYTSGVGFYAMFALFFPAVTGVMAGANMSGDLRDPATSIPRGTLGAVLATGMVYVGLALLLGASASRADLLANPLIMRDMAWSPLLINVGIFAATLSSALGSMMGAPRILQAFAKDRIIKQIAPFAPGSGAAKEPRRATVLTFLIAEAAVLLGDLNAIAPIITMFFMITYGTLNLACFYESRSANPSFRPSFHFSHWSTALAGALGCGLVMLVMEPVWAVFSILGMAGLHRWIARLDVHARWGDVQSGMAYKAARQALLRLEAEDYHPKNWRPTVLALSGGPWERFHLAEHGHWLTAGRGVLSLGLVVEGEVESRVAKRRKEEARLRTFIREQDLDAFAVVVVSDDVQAGVQALVQCHGIGGIRPNLVLLGWCDDPPQQAGFCATLRLTARLGRSLVVLRADEGREARWAAPPGTVDVWWDPRHGPLLLLLAYLWTCNDAWRDRRVRLLACGMTHAELARVLSGARIDAEPVVVTQRDLTAAVRAHSGEAALVLLPLGDPPAEGAEAAFLAAGASLHEATDGVLARVWNAGDVELEA